VLHEHFPETLALRHIGELYQTLGRGIAAQDRREAPTDPAATEALARARALHEIFGRTIRRSWYCIRALADSDFMPKSRESLAAMSKALAGTPEAMRLNGLYLLIALNAPVDDAVFREMSLRYFWTSKPALPRPESVEQCVLLYPATKGMEYLQTLRREAEEYQQEPQSHADFPERLRQAIPELFSAIYAIQHYLVMGDSGERQVQGLRDLDQELSVLQAAGQGLRIGPRSERTVDSVLGELRATVPVQETEPGLYRKLSQEILQRGSSPVAASPSVTGPADPRAATKSSQDPHLPPPIRRPKGP
jgi:hypothetical protein